MRLLVTLWTLFAAPLVADACTCFFVSGGESRLFARNYDWNVEAGVVTVNKRGLQKTAFSFNNPAKWTSKYGSVTFNQYGREFPNDGMNEAGLVVAVMWLRETRYPAKDNRASVGSAQWLQYQLDTASTVDEVLASDSEIRISPLGGGQVHYLVADAKGNCAAVEWIGGERVVHTGESLVANALTNSTYEKSAAYLKRHEGFGGTQRASHSSSSLDRFVRASQATRANDASADKLFASLKSCAQRSQTKWSIVYNLAGRSIQFKTHSAPAIKTLNFAQLDFDSSSPTLVVDLETEAAGDVAPRLVEYNTQQNLKTINRTYDATFFLSPLPATARQMIARYPETYRPPAADLSQPLAEALGQ